MVGATTRHDAPTRRDYLRGGGALVSGSVLAGCANDAAPTTTNTTTTTTTTAATTTTTTDDSYTVTMAPAGEVTFETVPERIFTRLTHHAGMAFALGRGNDVNAMHAPDYYHALWNQFTPLLDGVTLDWQGLYSSWNPSKEKLYELDSDVHLTDPASVFALDGWTMADIEEIRRNVAPWFGNKFSDRHDAPPSQWADEYRYYGLWEMFEKVARVFKETARYEALASVRADLLATIEERLPPANERPTAVMAGLSEIENAYVYTVDTPGFLTAHVRPLKPTDAFDSDVSSGDTVDMEAMLNADPDVIFALGGMHPNTDMPGIRQALRDHPVGSELAAVRNDRVYAQGARYQGPVLNLFQLEMTAKQLYPDRFGSWPRYEEGPYPEIPRSEQLFDRDRVAAVIRGDL